MRGCRGDPSLRDRCPWSLASAQTKRTAKIGGRWCATACQCSPWSSRDPQVAGGGAECDLITVLRDVHRVAVDESERVLLRQAFAQRLERLAPSFVRVTSTWPQIGARF